MSKDYTKQMKGQVNTVQRIRAYASQKRWFRQALYKNLSILNTRHGSTKP